jgi:hypothetical protein
MLLPRPGTFNTALMARVEAEHEFGAAYPHAGRNALLRCRVGGRARPVLIRGQMAEASSVNAAATCPPEHRDVVDLEASGGNRNPANAEGGGKERR